MVSMTSASRYKTLSLWYDPCYQSRSSIYIRGLIPLNFAEWAKVVPTGTSRCALDELLIVLLPEVVTK